MTPPFAPRDRTRRLLRWLRPEEWLCVLFALLLALLTTFCTGPEYGWPGLWRTLRWAAGLSLQRDIPFFSSHLAFFLLLGGGAFLAHEAVALVRPGPAGRGASAWRAAQDFAALLRSYVPFLACYVLYALLRDMIHYLRVVPRDPLLARVEVRLFGTLAATAVHDALDGPAATWLLAKAYASHFYAAPLTAFLLYVRRERRLFRDLMLAVTLSAFAAYLGYLILPVGGPRYAVADWAAIRAAQAGEPTLQFVDFWGRTAADCFPSLHTAWTVLTAVFLWRFSRPLFALYLPVGVLLLVACLYFGFHYLADLPAGAAVAAAAAWAAGRWNRWWYVRVADLAETPA